MVGENAKVSSGSQQAVKYACGYSNELLGSMKVRKYLE